MNPKINPPIIILYLSLLAFTLCVLMPSLLNCSIDFCIYFVYIGMFLGCSGTIVWMTVQLNAIPKEVKKIRICSCGKPILDLYNKKGEKIGVTHSEDDEEHHFKYWSTEEVQNRIKNN